MPSARVQRRIDGLLDQAEEAIAAMDWSRVRQAVEGVLAVDTENADAQSFLAIAERASAVDGNLDAATVVLTSGQPTVVPTDATPV